MSAVQKYNRQQNFTKKMQGKLLVLFACILVAFVALIARLYVISRDNGEDYKKQILSQQEYDSVTIPYKRGDIIDANGTILACSNKVYNVILDTKMLLSKEEYLEPTLTALRQEFGFDIAKIRDYIEHNEASQYYILAKKLSYDEISGFLALMDDKENNPYIKGIWFEDEYERQYPNKTLACDAIGFMIDEKTGYGLESYYDDVLRGVNGREYGYLNEDSTLERTTIAAQDGDTIVTTLDSNIQSIVEKYLKAFNDEYKDNYHVGNGAENVGCVIMEVDTGNVLAMASYPFFDLNDTRNTDALIGMRQVDWSGTKTDGSVKDEYLERLSAGVDYSKILEEKKKAEEESETEEDGSEMEENSSEEESSEETPLSYDSYITEKAQLVAGKYVTEESIAAMDDALLYQNLNALWKNYCINDTYEPGSVAKPFTVATAIDDGKITGNEYYNCEGFLHVGDHDIKCHNIYGDGYLSVAEAIERSCNVAMMHIAAATGKEEFLRYQRNFGFGLKTNVDLAGESRTDLLVYNPSTMGPTDLATNSFGQGFNTTMIQMITGFCSLINGGNLYEPHMVQKIMTSDGATIRNIEPRVLKQTISQTTSERIIEFCNQVVTGENGTGKTARPAGYMIGGKTGTAQTLPRGNNEYVVSFMGYAPADDPQIAIYVVVDRPNVFAQADAKYATRIVRNILTEVLPYMHIYMTEELTEKELQELEEKKLQDTIIMEQENTEGDENAENGEAPPEEGIEATEEEEVIPEVSEPWRDFPIDPATGYAVDPNTGDLVDPNTGAAVSGGDSLSDGTENAETETSEDINESE